MTPRIKGLWKSLALNAAAAALNLTLTVSNIFKGNWLWLINIAGVALSLYMVRWLWLKMKQVDQEERQRVVGYLSGEIG